MTTHSQMMYRKMDGKMLMALDEWVIHSTEAAHNMAYNPMEACMLDQKFWHIVMSKMTGPKHKKLSCKIQLLASTDTKTSLSFGSKSSQRWKRNLSYSDNMERHN